MSSAAATVKLLVAGVPAARRKCEVLGSTLASDIAAELVSAEDEGRQLSAALRDAEAEAPQTIGHAISAAFASAAAAAT